MRPTVCEYDGNDTKAACLAVYVHGLAADMAVESTSSLVASYIITGLGKTRLQD